MNPPSLLTDYACIRQVHSFDELAAAKFESGINALCWRRTLPGGFSKIAELLTGTSGITPIADQQLRALPASPGTQAAVGLLLEDLRRLRDQGLSPELNGIRNYPCDEDSAPVRTDVYSFHADRAPIETDTWLCTYHGTPSEGLRNEDARRRVDLPATRTKLLECFGGKDDDDFRLYLEEHCYDLHYAAAPGAEPYGFGVGNLWRIAVAYPGSPVPPCIHRAPATAPGQAPRLLLIS